MSLLAKKSNEVSFVFLEESMWLKKLEIQGFKSFAEKTSFQFSSRMTGIVGPNGCGKSNVVDAIVWCLGEQSPKHLRGSQMSDVIFNGSKDIGAMGMASVTLTFDNKGNSHPIYGKYEELSVTRRLFRNGESEYLINKIPCRLKDISELFLDTGLGSRSYSIIEQGQISALIASKPIDRRFLIEEVAGISKFKVKKKSALSRISATEVNLSRISDIYNEVQKRMNALDRQVKKAKRYKELKLELESLEKRLLCHQYLESSATQNYHSQEKNIAVEQKNIFEHDLQKVFIKKESSDIDYVQTDTALKNIFSQQQTIERDLHESEKRKELFAQELEHIHLQKDRYVQEQNDLTEKLESFRNDYQQQNLLMKGLHEQYQQAQAQFEEIKNQKNQTFEKKQNVSSSIESKRKAQFHWLSEISRSRNQKQIFQKELGYLDIRLEEFEKQKSQFVQELRDVETQEIHSDELIAHYQEQQENVQSLLDQQFQEKQNFEQQNKHIEALLKDTQKNYHEKNSLLKTLSEFERRYEDYSQGVQTLMTDNRWSKHIDGIVAQHIRVKKGADAVEHYLSNILQVLFVNKKEQMQELIREITSNELGETHFFCEALSNDESIEHDTHDSGTKKFADYPGFLGYAADFIIINHPKPQSFKKFINNILSQVLYVRDLETAIQIHRDYQGKFACITQEALILSEKGIITCGAKKNSILSRKEQIITLQDEVKNLELETETLEEKKIQTQEHLIVLIEAIEKNKFERDELHVALKTKLHEKEQIQKKHESVSSRIRVIQLELEQFDKEKIRIHQEIITLDTTIHDLVNKQQEIESSLLQLEQEIQNIQEKLDTFEQALSDVRVNKATFEENIKNIQIQTERLKNIISETERKIARLESDRNLGITRVSVIERDMKIESEKILHYTSALEKLAVQKNDFQMILEALHQALILSTSDIAQYKKEISSIEKKIHDHDMVLADAASNLKHLSQLLFEKYQTTFDEDLYHYHSSQILEEKQILSIGDLKTSIQSLGEINLSAIEEYQELEERSGFLSVQKQDLEDALNKLKNAIKKMDITSKDRFQKAFEAINQQFQDIFPKLFKGGKAYLELTEPDNLLETGLDIIAQPSGKKFLSMNLLSGGEKTMTAMALLFAIFVNKPSPFCLLDEADAPLDDANIERFKNLIKNMALLSQFIVITHNKGTMEIADKLYGVTMETPGVSKCLSVSLTAATEKAA